MFSTKNYNQAVRESEKTGKPIWKSEDGYFAVADEMEFAETGDAYEWTEIDS